MHTYIDTYIHTYIHTYIYTYRLTYIIHTYMVTELQKFRIPTERVWGNFNLSLAADALDAMVALFPAACHGRSPGY